jgi:deferrochelatase/peroxidase EfeB
MADPRLSRRALLTAAGVGGAALVAGGGVVAERELTGDSEQSDGTRVPFYGPQQAGIATPAQDRLHFASFDVVTESRTELRDMLRAWTVAAARMTAGAPAGPVNDDLDAPPDDTGEALGLPPSRLTVTIGFGPTLFTLDGNDRFGLAPRQPKALVELPAFADDALQAERSGGDICVQACADDPQVAFHAVRNLTRIGRGVVVMRWSQLGFGRTSSTTRSQETPRNLMGFKDGTNNIKAEEKKGLADHVWVSVPEPGWLQGGSYVVARRIRMLIETWDRASLADQQLTIGRVKDTGAPLGGHREFDDVDLKAHGEDGLPVIPVDAHIRLAAPSENAGIRILRRGYSFTDGMDERLGQLDAGLFFIGFMHDPDSFIKLQHTLGRNDALNEYISHTGSALFAVPPGVQPRGYVGQGLFA